MRVAVGVADQCRVVEAPVFGCELEVPLDQGVDGELLVALALEPTAVADLGDERGERFRCVGPRPAYGAEGSAALA